jgi:protocatechuate 3,4-dioxygenase beta subunit
MRTTPPGPSRRRFLQLSGASVLAVALAACGGDDEPADDAAGRGQGGTSTGGDGGPPTTTGTTPPAPSGDTPAADEPLTAAHFAGLAACMMTVEQMAGPFPLDEQFDRADITEGSPGHPLRLGLRVVDEACEPIAGATVEVWHADASGDYSAFVDGGGGKDEGPGTTFLRGTRTAGDDGIVDLTTIWPGWYTGRAVHIHVRVRVDGELVLTSQLYFDDDANAEVLATGAYAEFGPPDTTNATDGIAGDPATGGNLLVARAATTANGAGSLALANLGVPRP